MQHVDGGFWRDRLDFAWVDAFNDSVWIYAAELAAEAVRMGFEEVQYDYVRFPDEPESRLASALFPGRRPGETKRQGVTRNLQLLGIAPAPECALHHRCLRPDHQRQDRHGYRPVSGTISSPPRTWCCRWSIPSHYTRGVYNLKHPNSEPYQVIRRAMQDALAPLRAPRQDGGDPAVSPGVHPGPAALHPALVREQIRASEELGLEAGCSGTRAAPTTLRSSAKRRRR